MKLMERMTLYNIIYNEYLSWNLLVLLEIYLFIKKIPYRRAKGDKSSGEAIARGKVAMIYKCDTDFSIFAHIQTVKNMSCSLKTLCPLNSIPCVKLSPTQSLIQNQIFNKQSSNLNSQVGRYLCLVQSRCRQVIASVADPYNCRGDGWLLC